jgi:hypothetical protein
MQMAVQQQQQLLLRGAVHVSCHHLTTLQRWTHQQGALV